MIRAEKDVTCIRHETLVCAKAKIFRTFQTLSLKEGGYRPVPSLDTVWRPLVMFLPGILANARKLEELIQRSVLEVETVCP